MRQFVQSSTMALVMVAEVTTASAKCLPGDIRIEASSLSSSETQEFRSRFATAVDKVCDWWGATWTGPINIEVMGKRGPSMALVPAWRGDRGRMIFRAPTVRNSSSAIIHEIVHVVAPNANRFLAEGLAVYAQERLQGQMAFPNYGADVHEEAARLAGPSGLATYVLALERYATPRRLRSASLDERQGYLIAGSFVRYLIETFGLEKFRALYDVTPLVSGAREPGTPVRWHRSYGKSLSTLAMEWERELRR